MQCAIKQKNNENKRKRREIDLSSGHREKKILINACENTTPEWDYRVNISMAMSSYADDVVSPLGIKQVLTGVH